MTSIPRMYMSSPRRNQWDVQLRPAQAGFIAMKALAAQNRRAAVQRARGMGVPRLPFQAAPLAQRRGNMEIKSFDSLVTGGALPLIAAAVGAEPAAAFAGLSEFNCVPQGATVANRIGNKIVIKSIHIKGSLVNNNLANLAVARLAVIYDKQPNGAFPGIADILTDQPAGAASFYGGLNIANKSRFQVIRDGFYNLDAAQSQIHTFNIYAKGRWEVEFGANAGNIGDFRTGALYLVAFYANSVVVLTTVACRIRYFD